MAIVDAPPATVEQCAVMGMLRKKAIEGDGAFDKALVLVQNATPLLDLIIAGPFREYTLHNRDHAKKILHLAENLVPGHVLEQFSQLDCLLLVYSAYLHDLGMCLTSTERQRLVASGEFVDHVREWDELSMSLANAREKLKTSADNERLEIETQIYQLQEAGLASFLRVRHATPGRYAELIHTLKQASKRQDLFEYRGVSLEQVLIDICASHNLDVVVLAENKGPFEERFPRQLALGGAYLNAQFCAAVLRLADILDFDRERTPRVLFESLGIEWRSLPGADISLREWQKHIAVHTIEINEDEIVVSAECRNPIVEKTIRDFCLSIERELRDTLAVIRRNPPQVLERYNLELPVSVRASIRSIGYVFRDVSLNMNQPRIMSLLMGNGLYNSPYVAVRELIQNGLDACALRAALDNAPPEPLVTVRITTDADASVWLEVKDNGCGMDEHVLTEYLLRLGNSYYDSPECRRLLRSYNSEGAFTAISRFGIGFASVFMLGDAIEVRTKSSNSPRKDFTGRLLRIERLGGLAFIAESEPLEDGTTVRVRLRPAFVQDLDGDGFVSALLSYMQQNVVRPLYPVELHLRRRVVIFSRDDQITFQNSGLAYLDGIGVEALTIDVGRWSERLSGIVIFVLFRSGEYLSYLNNGRPIRLGSGNVDPKEFLQDYRGNRLTVNGFRMMVNKVNRVFGSGKTRLPFAYDLEMRGDDEVEYDISRARLTSTGRGVVFRELRMAVVTGMKELGHLDRMDVATRILLRDSAGASPIDNFEGVRTLDESFLDKVLELVPPDVWPQGLNKTIAGKLNVPNGLVSRALGELLRLGRATKPRRKEMGVPAPTGE